MTPRAHTETVQAVAFSPDGKYFATSSDDGTAVLWDISSGTQAVEKYTLTGHRAVIYALDFSPDGKFLATGSADTETRVWNVATGATEFTLYGHTDRIYSVDFSPDGKYLATAGADTTIHVHYLQLSDLIQSALERVVRTVTPEDCLQYLATCPEP